MRKVESMTSDPFDALRRDDPIVEPDADFVARLGQRLGVNARQLAQSPGATINVVAEVLDVPTRRNRRRVVFPVVAAAAALAAIAVGAVRSQSRNVVTTPSDSNVASTAPAVSTTVTTVGPRSTTVVYEAGMFDVSTVEDLTQTSDLIGFVQFGQKLNRDGWDAELSQDDDVVNIRFSEVLRGAATEHTLVVMSKEQAASIEGKPALLFLRTPSRELFPGANLIGPIMTLTPGYNSILLPDGTDLVTTGDGFRRLRRQETFGGPAGHRLPRSDVVAVASDPTIGPTIPWPRQDPPPPLTEADNAWLARLDASCAAAKQRADELTTILTNANASGSISAADAVRVLDLFAQLRGGEDALNDQSGVSADIIAKWERSKSILAAAEPMLADAIPRTGADLTDSLVRFRQKAREYQGQWSGVPAPHCTMFLQPPKSFSPGFGVGFRR
jgi:hypothetical protein